jgi:hypothetical protein
VLSDKGRGSVARGEVVHEAFRSETGKRASRERLPELEADPEPGLLASGLGVGLVDDVVVALGSADEEPSPGARSGVATLDLGVCTGTTAAGIGVVCARQELRRAWRTERLWWCEKCPWGNGPALTRTAKNARKTRMVLSAYIMMVRDEWRKKKGLSGKETYNRKETTDWQKGNTKESSEEKVEKRTGTNGLACSVAQMQ